MQIDEIDLDAIRACTAVIEESRRITPDSTAEVRHIGLRIDDPSFRYLEGQVIGVLIRGPHAFGNANHHRFYSIANPRGGTSGDGVRIELLVRRCFYLDEVSGERYPGIASNFLCDAAPGQKDLYRYPRKSRARADIYNRFREITEFCDIHRIDKVFIDDVFKPEDTRKVEALIVLHQEPVKIPELVYLPGRQFKSRILKHFLHVLLHRFVHWYRLLCDSEIT